MTESSWAEKLFEDQVTVASETETVERGGILAWRYFVYSQYQNELRSLVSRNRWHDQSWHGPSV